MKEKAIVGAAAGGLNPETSLPSTIQPVAEHQAADATNYSLIKDEANQLIAMRLQLATVIPVELPAEQYPAKRKNKSGQWEDALKYGKPQPMFTGKNPSHWAANGEPQTIKHGNPPTGEQVLAAIDTAERLRKPIGLAILPTNGVCVADFDPKDYEGGVQELKADFERLLAKYPVLKDTRIERTPSGGIHIYLRPADAMEGWKKPNGGYYGQFTTTPGGQMRGEMLAGTRVSVTAPTFHRSSRREGSYSCLHSPYKLVEVPSLESLGMYRAKGKGKPEPQPSTKQAPTSKSVSERPQLINLLGRSAQEVLKGGTPYGDDRSTNLTGFAKEAYGVRNWLDDERLPYQGTAEQLIQQAIEMLNIEDKAERVLSSIDPADCDCDTAKVKRRYEYQLRPGWPSGFKQQNGAAKILKGFEDQSPPPASFQALIQLLPDGWSEKGNQQTLTPGRLAEMLPSNWLRFNELDLRAEIQTSSGWKRITDACLDSAYVLLTAKGWRITAEPVVKSVLHAARQCPHHPVRDYLKQIEVNPNITPFDLDQVGPRFFRATNPLHVEMIRKWLIGAVARALHPGCQMDYCLVLQGEQGQQKSRFIEALASKDLHCCSVPENEKDLLLNVHSTWIYELAELESVTNRKESGRLKNLITTSIDNMRPPYGRTAERLPRQSVFAATVNEDTFLRDDTGNRRYWVVPVEGAGPLDPAGIAAARDSILKAAVIAYRSGELPMLSTAMETLSATQNEDFNQQDPWVEMVRAWMDGDPLARWDRDRDPSPLRYDPEQPFTSAEVLYSAGLRRPDQIQRYDENRIAAVLKKMGFQKRKQERVGGRKVRRWELSQPPQPPQPQGAGVVTPQTDCTGMGLPTLSQPPQPFSGKRRR
jgi:hypothetical protein